MRFQQGIKVLFANWPLLITVLLFTTDVRAIPFNIHPRPLLMRLTPSENLIYGGGVGVGGGGLDIKWNGPKWKASHPHTWGMRGISGRFERF